MNEIDYEVRIDPLRLELTVTMTLTGDVANGDIRLEIPAWVPGDYTFAPYARDLFDLRANDTSSGTELTVTRQGFSSFVVAGGMGAVTVSYRAYAGAAEFAEPCGLVDGRYAILLGGRYLNCPSYSGPCRVSYGTLSADWRIHHPSGARRDGTSNTWIYPGFEILLDTPVVFGHFDLLERDVEGTKFYFVFVDRGVGFEASVDRFVDRLAVASRECGKVFGGFPFDDYTFVMSLNPDADWGLEHLTSSMCGLGPDVFVDPDQFATGVRVCAHELFHAWNVRRLRPAPLGDLRHALTTGCFTEGLWLAEGFTRYYEFLIATRARAYTPEQFFSTVVGYYEHLTAQPAYSRVSAIDSSLATYLNHSKYAGRVDNAIDYYDKGMLVAFDLDVALRTGGDGTGLDPAFRAFYETHVGVNKTPGYTTTDVVAFFNDVLPGLGDTLHGAVTAPSGLVSPDMLASLGFEVTREERRHLGLVFLDGSEPTLYNVDDDSPAGVSGLAPGDRITRINGFSFTPAALRWVATNPEPVTLSVQRGHREIDVTLTPTSRTRITALIWQGTPEQARRIGEWLGQPDFQPTPGQHFSLQFYANFHGIETAL